MTLLIDLSGFVAVLLDGLSMLALTFTLGGVAFLSGLARPLAGLPDEAGKKLLGRTRTILIASAFGLAITMAARLGLQVHVLIGTADLGLAGLLGATFMRAGGVVIVAAVLVAVVALTRFDEHRRLLLPLLVCMVLGAVSLLSHGAARLDDRWVLIGLIIVHLGAISLWLGGLPYFLSALALSPGHDAARRIAVRFSVIATFGVLGLAASGVGLSWYYVDSPEALYGTAYGSMLAVKILIFFGLLCFGVRNLLIVGRLWRTPDAPVLVMRRFAEVELGAGIAAFFCAATLAAMPPAVDLQQDRVTWDQLIERMTPDVANLTQPVAEALTALSQETTAGAAAVPGASDQAWSEANHHLAGLMVLLIGALALIERSGVSSLARHWPLLFLGLVGLLAVRVDPLVWPFSMSDFWDSLRDPEVARHRLFCLLLAILALVEWTARLGSPGTSRVALVFPLLVATGGTLMLLHPQALEYSGQEVLIGWTHLPIAVLGIASGWSRWLEVRLPPSHARAWGWLWPICFLLIGALLLFYREA